MAVLWISAIVAAFALSVTLSVRSHVLFERNAMRGSLARGIADGLAKLTALAVTTPGSPAAGVKRNGEWQACRWSEQADAWFSVQDQGGLVDLNTASRPLLEAVLMGFGLSTQEARDMASAIRDFRDEDATADFGRGEADAYAGRAYGPKDAAFQAVEELDRIPGMNAALYAALREVTTVRTQQSGFDPRTAPAALLAAIQRGQPGSAISSFASSTNGGSQVITVAVQLTDGTRFVRGGLIAATGQPDMPFVARSWDSLPWPRQLPFSTSSEGACLVAALAGASGAR